MFVHASTIQEIIPAEASELRKNENRLIYSQLLTPIRYAWMCLHLDFCITCIIILSLGVRKSLKGKIFVCVIVARLTAWHYEKNSNSWVPTKVQITPSKVDILFEWQETRTIGLNSLFGFLQEYEQFLLFLCRY